MPTVHGPVHVLCTGQDTQHWRAARRLQGQLLVHLATDDVATDGEPGKGRRNAAAAEAQAVVGAVELAAGRCRGAEDRRRLQAGVVGSLADLVDAVGQQAQAAERALIADADRRLVDRS